MITKEMSEPIIRFIKPTDLRQLVILCKKHAMFEKSTYDSKNKLELLEKSLFKETPDLFCLVVEFEDNLIGYATYTKQYSTWDASFYTYMDCLFLIESCRGFGVGEKLINKIKISSIEMGCNLIQWQTPIFNERAIKFYKRIGAKSKNKERFFLETIK